MSTGAHVFLFHVNHFFSTIFTNDRHAIGKSTNFYKIRVNLVLRALPCPSLAAMRVNFIKSAAHASDGPVAQPGRALVLYDHLRFN